MKTAFDKAIGTVPPSAVDVDAVIRRGRRTVWLRHARRAAGVGVAAVAVVAAFVRFTPAPERLDTPGWTASRPPSTAPSLGPVSADIEQRLNAAFADRIATDAPGAGYVNPDPSHKPRIATFISSYQKAAADRDGVPFEEHDYEAVALLKDAAGVSQLRVVMFDIYAFPYSCQTVTADCEISARPNGDRVYRGIEQVDGKKKFVAAVGKADGTTVEVESFTDLAEKSATATGLHLDWKPKGFGKARSTPLLSLDELEEIAADPRLSFRP